MKRITIILSTLLLIAAPGRAQEPLSPEVQRMIEYLMLADDAGLDVPLYIMELSDQLAMLCLTDYMNKEILEQGQAAAELYGHPLVCMNYAACLMKQRKYGSALHYLNKAWKQDNRNAMVATNIARCHFELGDDKNCEAFVNKALALDPDYGLALQLKASLLLNRGGDKNQQEAVECILRSALDVWNGISVRHFNSLLSCMEQLYYKYDEALPLMENDLEKLPTPLDGLEKYFKPLMRAGRIRGEEPPEAAFNYPVLDVHFGLYPDNRNDYEEEARKVNVPIVLDVSRDYPLVFSGLGGGNEYLPDSRAFHVTLLAYYYHKIKLLEATVKTEQQLDHVIESFRKSLKKREEGINEIKEKEADAAKLTAVRLESLDKEYGEALVDYETKVANQRIEIWKKYMKPALKAYHSDITTGLTYVGTESAFTFIQSRFDRDIAEIYQEKELVFMSELQNEINTYNMILGVVKQFADDERQAEQEYLNELARTRNKRLLDWDASEKLKAAGMADLNRSREPIPHFTFKLGPYSFKLGVDRSNRIHFRMDSPWESVNRVYNPETGASSTMVLRDVNAGKTPSLEEMEHSALNLNGTVSYGSGTSMGKQVVTDGRGNIIESSNVREESGSMGLGTSIPGTPLGASGSFSYRKTTARANRFGASTVPYSARGTLGLDAGYSVGSFNIISAGVGVSQGGL